MNPAAILADYTATAEAWRKHFARAPRSHLDLSAVPLAAVLLYAFAEPLDMGETFTGDVLSDALGGTRSVVVQWRAAADRGGGGVAEIDSDELRALERRLAAVIEVRRRSLLVISGGAL